jgi:hypothetical protein
MLDQPSRSASAKSRCKISGKKTLAPRRFSFMLICWRGKLATSTNVSALLRKVVPIVLRTLVAVLGDGHRPDTSSASASRSEGNRRPSPEDDDVAADLVSPEADATVVMLSFRVLVGSDKAAGAPVALRFPEKAAAAGGAAGDAAAPRGGVPDTAGSATEGSAAGILSDAESGCCCSR